ncbi:L-2-amino-thiazoline-4-carboxylic acid hydrolase [bacterium]|nr:L-2-amino-thiazoline-4-carboxylic acid hydrolase [bacterium]
MSAMRLLRPFLAHFARRGLALTFERAQTARILDDALADYEAQQAKLPREASLGGRMMVHLAALTIGFYRALVIRDLTAEDARWLTGRVTALAYEKMAFFPTLLSRVGAPGADARLRRATNVFRKFPFSAPSYEMVNLPAENGIVAFDVRRCPVARYFREHGLGELCVTSWCNLDYALAERWDAHLERHGSIAAGDLACDFRWIPRGENTKSERRHA